MQRFFPLSLSLFLCFFFLSSPFSLFFFLFCFKTELNIVLIIDNQLIVKQLWCQGWNIFSKLNHNCSTFENIDNYSTVCTLETSIIAILLNINNLQIFETLIFHSLIAFYLHTWNRKPFFRYNNLLIYITVLYIDK